MSFGGNPPWIMQVENSTLKTKLNPYDYEEMGEFYNETEIETEAIKYLKEQGITQVYTFTGRPNVEYFRRSLSTRKGDDINTFSSILLDSNFLTRAGIEVTRIEQSELEQHCSQ